MTTVTLQARRIQAPYGGAFKCDYDEELYSRYLVGGRALEVRTSLSFPLEEDTETWNFLCRCQDEEAQYAADHPDEYPVPVWEIRG